MAEKQPPPSPRWPRIGSKTDQILTVRDEIARRRTWQSALIERIGSSVGHPTFFIVLFILHALWVLLNLPVSPWWDPWDPYPFIFLATVASVEAPFITILVLMRQQRDSRIDELREETHLQVSLHVERELTMTLRLLGEIQEHFKIRSQEDPQVLANLRSDFDPGVLLEKLRQDLQEAEEDRSSTSP